MKCELHAQSKRRDITTISNSSNSGFPLYTMLINHWGLQKTFAFVFIIAIVGAFGGAGIVFTYSAQIAAFARDGGLPMSHTLSKINVKTSTPLYSTALLVIGSFLILLFG